MLGLEMFMETRKSKKCNDIQVITPVAYASGFMPLDYMNGQLVEVYDENDELVMEYDSVGFVGGSMVTMLAFQ